MDMQTCSFGSLPAGLPQQFQQFLHQGSCLGMEKVMVLSPVVILQGMVPGIGSSLIVLAGCDPVTDHLYHIFYRHLHASQLSVLQTVVHPVFQVMFVPALMVEPGGGNALRLPLGIVGAAHPVLVIFCSGPELHRGVFAHVMEESLLIQPALPTMYKHQPFVMVDGFQMFQWMQP